MVRPNHLYKSVPPSALIKPFACSLTRSQKRCFEMHLLLRHRNSSWVQLRKRPPQMLADSSSPPLQSVSPSQTQVFGIQLINGDQKTYVNERAIKNTENLLGITFKQKKTLVKLTPVNPYKEH